MESVPSKSQTRTVVNKGTRNRLTGCLGDFSFVSLEADGPGDLVDRDLVGERFGGDDLGDEGLAGEDVTAGGVLDGDDVATGTFDCEGSTLLGTVPVVSVFVCVSGDGELVLDVFVSCGVSEGAAGVLRV